MRFLSNPWTDSSDLTTVLKVLLSSKTWCKNQARKSPKIYYKTGRFGHLYHFSGFFGQFPGNRLAHLVERLLIALVAKYQENHTTRFWVMIFQRCPSQGEIGNLHAKFGVEKSKNSNSFFLLQMSENKYKSRLTTLPKPKNAQKKHFLTFWKNLPKNFQIIIFFAPKN